MLNDVSNRINKRMSLEESANDFLTVINDDFECSFLNEDVSGKQINFNGNGDELSMFDNNYFDESTEFDPDLTTSLQDETDADDDATLNDPSDIDTDLDLFKEVDYNDNYSYDYVNDTDPNSSLDKEVDYVDNYDSNPDLSDFVVDECGDFLMEDDECQNDGTIPGDEADDITVGGDTDATSAPIDEQAFLEAFIDDEEEPVTEDEDEFEDIDECGDNCDDLDEDYFMESDDEDVDTDLDEDFFAESDDEDLEDIDECGDTDLDEDYFMESDEDLEDIDECGDNCDDLDEDYFMESDDEDVDTDLDEDFFMEDNDGTMTGMDHSDFTTEYRADDDEIEQDDPEDVGAFADTDDDEDLDFDDIDEDDDF